MTRDEAVELIQDALENAGYGRPVAEVCDNDEQGFCLEYAAPPRRVTVEVYPDTICVGMRNSVGPRWQSEEYQPHQAREAALMVVEYLGRSSAASLRAMADSDEVTP